VADRQQSGADQSHCRRFALDDIEVAEPVLKRSRALTEADHRMNGAEEFGKLYESVPIQAAQRAFRFWKAGAAGSRCGMAVFK